MTYFNDVSSLKVVELKKLCRSHGIDETYPKRAKFSYVMFWDWQPLVITESKVLTDHLSPAQIEVLHVPDVDILDYKF